MSDFLKSPACLTNEPADTQKSGRRSCPLFGDMKCEDRLVIRPVRFDPDCIIRSTALCPRVAATQRLPVLCILLMHGVWAAPLLGNVVQLESPSSFPGFLGIALAAGRHFRRRSTPISFGFLTLTLQQEIRDLPAAHDEANSNGCKETAGEEVGPQEISTSSSPGAGNDVQDAGDDMHQALHT
ncbi:MAG: hypothetical protein EPO07_15900 [Verrucomicrobia bacterium]|nr:MAG: hypothetical protein EPO07_15900 [Verrucomicrobiota bacterium]